MSILSLTRKILKEHTSSSTGSAEIILLGFTESHVQSEHIGRYLFASSRVKGVVLDAAAGSCYGASILGRRNYTVALDIQPDLLSYGKRVYNLSLHDVVQADAGRPPFRQGGFDTVVSLEAIEHLNHPARFITEAGRCLKRNGLLLLSTPNKLYTSPFCPHSLNPYHLREFYYGELTRLVAKSFALERAYGQERVSVMVFIRRIISSLLKYVLRKTNFDISAIDDAYSGVRKRTRRGCSANVEADPSPLLDRIERLRRGSNLFPYEDILLVLRKRG